MADREGRATIQWWRFWFALFNRSAATIPYLVGAAVIAAGTTQGTATALTDEWNEITTTPVNSGVLLFDFGEGLETTVWNVGANALKVYPPIGAQIDALGVNAAYSLAVNKAQVFYQLSATQWRSLQLG